MRQLEQQRDEAGRFLPQRFACDSCQIVTINGRPCHETGCRKAWIDPRTGMGYPALCWCCGCDFIPDDRPNRYSVCGDCEHDAQCAQDL